jgi:hypothetical protein
MIKFVPLLTYIIYCYWRITGMYIDPPVPLTYFQSTLEMNHNNHKPTQLNDIGCQNNKQ